MTTCARLGGGEVAEISRNTSVPVEEVQQIMTLMTNLDQRPARRRGKAESVSKAPAGGISIREAARKYSVRDNTLSRWVQRGYIRVVLTTCWAKYVSEEDVARVVEIYRKQQYEGSRVVKRTLELAKAG